MFNTRFENGYQTINPNMNMDVNGYSATPQDPYAVYNTQDPYSASYNPESMMQNIPYPTPPAQMNTGLAPQNYNPAGFAKGGQVKKQKGSMQNKPYHVLAEMIRQQGKGEDTILAHINPLEAMMLKQMGGSGTINKETGLPQFGLFSNPGKWFKSVIGPAAGIAIGNMLLPGIGGMIGGALGGAGGSAMRGRKDTGAAALRGLGMGAAAPTLAGFAGSGLSALGAPGVGGSLTEYGNNNAIMPALDKLFGFGDGKVSGGMDSIGGAFEGSGMPAIFSANKHGSALQNYNKHRGLSGVSAGDDYEGEEDYGIKKKGKKGEESDENFFDKLLGNTGDYLSKPKNLLTLAAVGLPLLNRPKKEKPKTPEQIADEQKRFEKALMLSPAERAAREADLLAEARMQRSIARNKFLPEERLGNLDPLFRKSHTPDEQKKYGKWFSYYNNPNFTGEPLPFKKGGSVRSEIVNKAKKLTAEIIERNKNQYGGLLNEEDLIRDFINLDKTLGLTEEEKDSVERYAENIFRDIQFIDGPGYFYNQAHGNPTMKMKEGGALPDEMMYGADDMAYPSMLGNYIMGNSKGQDDDVNAKLSNGEFVIPADIVADLGDGNNAAGANALYQLMNNVRKHKRGGTVKLPPKAKPVSSYLK